MNWIEGLIETLLLSVAGTFLPSLAASLVGPVRRAREHCRCTAPTPGRGRPAVFDVRTSLRRHHG